MQLYYNRNILNLKQKKMNREDKTKHNKQKNFIVFYCAKFKTNFFNCLNFYIVSFIIAFLYIFNKEKHFCGRSNINNLTRNNRAMMYY